MKVTRDVIYDLLPAYFANEVSADTRTLIEEFFATDAEFGRMSERFRQIVEDKRHGEPATDAAQELETFERARMAAELPGKARTAALAWAMGSLLAWFMAFITWNRMMGLLNPGFLLGVIFLAGAVVCFIASFFVKPESPWRSLVGLDDETLKSVGYPSRGTGRR
jgi:hypothetical protein